MTYSMLSQIWFNLKNKAVLFNYSILLKVNTYYYNCHVYKFKIYCWLKCFLKNIFFFFYLFYGVSFCMSVWFILTSQLIISNLNINTNKKDDYVLLTLFAEPPMINTWADALCTWLKVVQTVWGHFCGWDLVLTEHGSNELLCLHNYFLFAKRLQLTE